MSLLISSAWSLIPIAVAASLTYNWQSETPPLFAFMTYKDKLMPILNNPQAEGVRYYIGLHDVGNYQDVPKVIVVGVDAQGNDIIDQTSPDSKILNYTILCPTVCPKKNSSLFHTEFGTNSGPEQIGETRPIPFNSAVSMTLAWQAIHAIKSVYISKVDLEGLFQHYGQDQLRFYFGKNSTQTLQTIVVGVNQSGDDVLGASIYTSTSAICTGNETSCNSSSPLYHDE